MKTLKDFLDYMTTVLKEFGVQFSVEADKFGVKLVVFRDNLHSITTNYCCGDYSIEIQNGQDRVVVDVIYSVEQGGGSIFVSKTGYGTTDYNKFSIGGNKFVVRDDGVTITVEFSTQS